MAVDYRAICIIRAPLLALWAPVLAERLGLYWKQSLALGGALKTPVQMRHGHAELSSQSVLKDSRAWPINFCRERELHIAIY